MTGDLYIRPLHMSSEKDISPGAAPLLASGEYYSAAEVTLRSSAGDITRREIVASGEILSWVQNNSPLHQDKALAILKNLSTKRSNFAGLNMSQPQIMAVINVTPDSFSDGGDRYDRARAVDDALRMRELGASILDVGGESTRPGAEPVSEEEELRRVLPVIEKLAEAGALVSIDTRHARVMREAVAAGAGIINDVTALEGDKDSLETAAFAKVPVILMHMQGTPQTMQANPCYQDVTLDVFDYLEKRVAACVAAGIPREMIAVDPGIGFGKTTEHNLRLLDAQALLHGTGCPLLLGVSRKGFIGKLSRGEEPKERVAGSLACALAGLVRGVQMYRVHDVAETAQAFAIARAIS